ncbi:hypothetical protein [Dactylosporangium matsuzakiense]|uniref:Uncharacterized protein n=1 Tax=Dactylosporangium matsuzakiense TaxID=53360 RepID=A0A9W6KAY6_9ACTN|nr:hypothetical protein [Dactylosporangium matsuzakiense]GLK98711.1 hypothetical protein GCM10017581_004520 [Dactylosporangium matsuzakiense]
MPDAAEELEQQLTALLAEIRQARAAGDRPRERMLRAQHEALHDEWESALTDLGPSDARSEADAPRESGSLLPLREQVHGALTLLNVAAAPKLIAQVYNACFGGDINSAKLTSLRRDEERSFRTAPFSRPYYLCAALTADRFAPVRGLLAISTWPLEQRIVGALSPRVDFLRAAVSIAEHVHRLPDTDRATARAKPHAVIRAANAELETHEPIDRSHREAAAARARAQLDDAGQLFGVNLKAVPHTGT